MRDDLITQIHNTGNSYVHITWACAMFKVPILCWFTSS